MKKLMTGVFAFSFLAISASSALAASCSNISDNSSCHVKQTSNKKVHVDVINVDTTVVSFSIVGANSGNQQNNNGDNNRSNSKPAKAEGNTTQVVNSTVVMVY